MSPHYILHDLSSPHLHYLLPRLMLESSHCFPCFSPVTLINPGEWACWDVSQIMPLHHCNLQWLSNLSKTWSQNNVRKPTSRYLCGLVSENSPHSHLLGTSYTGHFAIFWAETGNAPLACPAFKNPLLYICIT